MPTRTPPAIAPIIRFAVIVCSAFMPFGIRFLFGNQLVPWAFPSQRDSAFNSPLSPEKARWTACASDIRLLQEEGFVTRFLNPVRYLGNKTLPAPVAFWDSQ